MYRNNYRNNSLAYSSIEVLSVFFFALNKALHSVIQFSRLTGAKKKGLSVFSPVVQHGDKITKEKLDATNQVKGIDTLKRSCLLTKIDKG